MAKLNLAVVNTIFSELLTKEVNREATFLSLLSKLPERKSNIQWSVGVGGTQATGVAITGSAPAASQDVTIPAQLPINSSSLQSTFTLNLKEIEEAKEMVSNAELRQLLSAQMRNAVDEQATTLNRKLYNGTGAISDGGIIGLSIAAGTGDYAGIPSATYPLWQGQVVDCWDAGAAATDKRQALKTDFMLELDRKIRYRPGRYDLILTTPKVVEQYKKVFEANRSFQIMTFDGNRVPLVDLGFNVAGYMGTPIIDDVYCNRTRTAAESAITTALGTDVDEGVMYFLRREDLTFYSAPVQNSFSANGVYTLMRQLAQTSLYVDNFVVGCIAQLQLATRKNVGVIRNIKVA
jgi:hypothetical protein